MRTVEIEIINGNISKFDYKENADYFSSVADSLVELKVTARCEGLTNSYIGVCTPEQMVHIDNLLTWARNNGLVF